MANNKPDLVVLFTDPVTRGESRLLYWVDCNRGKNPRVLFEYREDDFLGEPRWMPQALGMRGEACPGSGKAPRAS